MQQISVTMMLNWAQMKQMNDRLGHHFCINSNQI